MSEKKTTETELSAHAQDEMIKISLKLNELQTTFDTRLLAAMLAGRAGMLYAMMINAGMTSKDEALMLWEKAAETIHNPPERETKIMKMHDGDIIPDKIN